MKRNRLRLDITWRSEGFNEKLCKCTFIVLNKIEISFVNLIETIGLSSNNLFEFIGISGFTKCRQSHRIALVIIRNKSQKSCYGRVRQPQ